MKAALLWERERERLKKLITVLRHLNKSYAAMGTMTRRRMKLRVMI